MKKLITLVLLTLVLSACSESSVGTGLATDGELSNVKVISKRTQEHYRASSDYYVTFGIKEEKVELEVSQNQYNMLKEGLTVNVSYNQSYGKVSGLSFPNLEGSSE